MRLSLFLLPFLVFLHVVSALLNITIDDNSTMIKYLGEWEPSSTHLSSLDYGGSHTFSSDSSASATLTFTGVAVYMLSPKWPYFVSMRLSIDGEPSTLVNLTDPDASPTPAGGSESAMYSVVWSATDLENTTHSVVATQGNYIIVDGFIYTVDNGSSPTSSSAMSSSTLTSSSLLSSSSSFSSSSMSASATQEASSAGASNIPSTHRSISIGLGTAFALMAVVTFALVGFGFYQRRRHRRVHSLRPKPLIDDWGSDRRVRGAYAAVAAGAAPHDHSLDSDSTFLLEPYTHGNTASGVSDPWEPEDAEFRDSGAVQPAAYSNPATHSQMPSAASQGSSQSGASALAPAPRAYGLPPGAMLPIMPSSYMDRAPPSPDLPRTVSVSARSGASASGRRSDGLSRVASSSVVFATQLEDDEEEEIGPRIQESVRIISSPPPYSR